MSTRKPAVPETEVQIRHPHYPDQPCDERCPDDSLRRFKMARAEAPQPDSHLDLASDKDDPMEAFGTRPAQPDSPPAERGTAFPDWPAKEAWLVENIRRAEEGKPALPEPAPTAEPPKCEGCHALEKENEYLRNELAYYMDLSR